MLHLYVSMIKNILIVILSILLIVLVGTSISNNKAARKETPGPKNTGQSVSANQVSTDKTPTGDDKIVSADIPTKINTSPHTTTPLKNGELFIEHIASGQKISNPLILKGSAPSNWYFEGSFGITIKDKNGNILGRAPAQSTSDWMNTNAPVGFYRKMNFKIPTTSSGTIVFSKDNPSDIRTNDESFVLPIEFTEYATSTKIVKVYFGNEIKNPKTLDCTAVYPVNREVANIPAIGKTTLIELLSGITPREQEQGYYTQLTPFTALNSLTIQDGIAYADFNDQLDFQVGGSCRTALISAQIIQTLKQFPTIKSVVISRDGQSKDILQP